MVLKFESDRHGDADLPAFDSSCSGASAWHRQTHRRGRGGSGGDRGGGVPGKVTFAERFTLSGVFHTIESMKNERLEVIRTYKIVGQFTKTQKRLALHYQSQDERKLLLVCYKETIHSVHISVIYF